MTAVRWIGPSVALVLSGIALGCGTPESDADGDGWTVEEGDCNDSDARVNPDATDACVNGTPRNLDCNGYLSIGGIDEFFIVSYCADVDGDGFGDPNNVQEAGSICDLQPPSGFSDNCRDCDDADPDRGPHGVEEENGVDDDCDGQVDEPF